MRHSATLPLCHSTKWIYVISFHCSGKYSYMLSFIHFTEQFPVYFGIFSETSELFFPGQSSILFFSFILVLYICSGEMKTYILFYIYIYVCVSFIALLNLPKPLEHSNFFYITCYIILYIL